MLVVRLDDGREWQCNPERVAERFVPASTSKIPHTLIALETGYAKSPEEFFAWDGVERAFDAWNRDHSLATAYAASAIWVYQRIAHDLGSGTMGRWLERFDYGNHDVGGTADLTSYWLDGPLMISAREQVAFLTKLATNDLPLKPQTLADGRRIMRADGGDGWTLYAKTGWGQRPGAADVGWYVGWVEREPGSAWVFALNLDMPDEAARAKRIPLTRAVLADLGAITTNEETQKEN
jgi:beta-lactamase class D